MKYKKLPVGEVITDGGVEWRRTNHRDPDSVYEDNYYYMPISCYCDVVDDAGYSFNDENGPCDRCEFTIRQIHSHNDDFRVDFDDPCLFDTTREFHIVWTKDFRRIRKEVIPSREV